MKGHKLSDGCPYQGKNKRLQEGARLQTSVVGLVSIGNYV